jgi:siroheme synthase
MRARGWDAATPAAVVLNGTRPDAVVWTGTLGEVGEFDVRALDAEAPGILVFGEVVRVREALAVLPSPSVAFGG